MKNHKVNLKRKNAKRILKNLEKLDSVIQKYEESGKDIGLKLLELKLKQELLIYK